MRKYVISLGKLIYRENKFLRKWLEEQRKVNGDLWCSLLPVKPSVSVVITRKQPLIFQFKLIIILTISFQPITTAYRNKSEFTIGQSIDGTGATNSLHHPF